MFLPVLFVTFRRLGFWRGLVAGMAGVVGVAGVAGVAGVGWGVVCLVWQVFGIAYRYRTEPKLRSTGNTYAATHCIRIGIDRTARLQPCFFMLLQTRIVWGSASQSIAAQRS